ncbi:MAG: hypothetical protein EON90_10645 [Brevundimonas sp.]|nr:MAG: hypothetical protein EON90_10645 [Brevundimonas sp.]
MTSGLTSDELGAAGEDLFAMLATRARLNVNRSDRDRTGWDFIVEFPMPEPGTGVTMDDRRGPVCFIQLKTTAGADPVSLRLSSAERLAKQDNPSFIIVLRLTRSGEPMSGYLIHLIGPRLARVLKRLRVAHAKGDFAVNRNTISFDYRRDGEWFEPTPEGLRGALEAACGPDPVASILEKRDQLENLGRERGFVEAEAAFQVESRQNLEDILLGLQPIRPVGFKAFDTRFGVRLPYQGPLFDDLEEIRLEPPSMGPCSVSIRGGPLSQAAVFQAEMTAGPMGDHADGVWMMIRHPEFFLKFRQDSVSFGSIAEFETPRALRDWIRLTRALLHLANGQGELVVTLGSAPDTQLRIPLTSSLTGPYIDQLPAILAMLEGWEKILGLAGVSHGSPFDLQAIWDANVISLAANLFSAAPTASFRFARPDLGEPDGPVDAVYINSAELGGVAASFAVRIRLGPGPVPDEFRSFDVEPLDARSRVADLQLYAEDLAQTHDINVIIHPDNLSEADD